MAIFGIYVRFLGCIFPNMIFSPHVFFLHAAVPGHERLVSDVFYLISSGRAVYVSFAGSSHFDWK